MPVPGTIKIHSGLTSIETKLDLKLMLKMVSSSSLLKTTLLTSMPTLCLTRMMPTFTLLQLLQVTLVDRLNSTLRLLSNQMDSLVLISIPQECILTDARRLLLEADKQHRVRFKSIETEPSLPLASLLSMTTTVMSAELILPDLTKSSCKSAGTLMM
jgi:hypothetical protein